jgi:hypothetical protein
MPKTILVLTCSECKFKEWCWEESRDVEENDPRGSIEEKDIPNYFCASARPKEE